MASGLGNVGGVEVSVESITAPATVKAGKDWKLETSYTIDVPWYWRFIAAFSDARTVVWSIKVLYDHGKGRCLNGDEFDSREIFHAGTRRRRQIYRNFIFHWDTIGSQMALVQLTVRMTSFPTQSVSVEVQP
jgi:hypothetical protein